jgi:superfamily I DNA and/or RNA helicase
VFVPVVREGNQSYPVEEVERVAGIVEYLTQTGTRWTDRQGDREPLTRDDILIVAPYNDQVNRLRDRLAVEEWELLTNFKGKKRRSSFTR